MFLHRSGGGDVNLLKERHKRRDKGFELLLFVLADRIVENSNEAISIPILVILREKRIRSAFFGGLIVKIQIQEGID